MTETVSKVGGKGDLESNNTSLKDEGWRKHEATKMLGKILST